MYYVTDLLHGLLVCIPTVGGSGVVQHLRACDAS